MLGDWGGAQISTAVNDLKSGKIIAYPTESVFGLGCDPFNEEAVNALLAIKNRESCKGFILIADSWDKVSGLVNAVPQKTFEKVMATWPGPVTWVFPVAEKVPKWLSGDHDSIAIRVTAHPVAAEICRKFAGPIVSTSANLSGHDPAKTAAQLHSVFSEKIATIVTGDVGGLAKPTPIIDAASGRIIRK